MKKKMTVFLCEECADSLKEKNPYRLKDGTPFPLEAIEVVIVPGNFCEFAEENLENKPQLQTPLLRKGAAMFPWRSNFWETEDDRNQGIRHQWGFYRTFNEAYEEACKTYDEKEWAAMEISYLFGDGSSVPVYLKARTDPVADEFIKHKER